MWIFDTDNLSILQVNNAAITSYGYSENEFTSLRLLDLVYDDFTETERISIIKETIKSNKVYKGRYKHKKKSGDIIDVEIYSNIITINDKRYESVIAIDVTEKILFERKITKAIIKTQEDERYEIGTELHDNVCQILASSQLSLEMLKDNIHPESLPWLNRSREFITLALQEIRNISHRLAPAFFDRTGLEEAFSDLLDDFNVNHQFQINLNVNLGTMPNKLNSEIQLNLYRILQEQLRNISKYAKAKAIEVDVIILKTNLIFSIADDGVGFDYNTVKKGIGLANIRRRAELFSGKMDIESAAGEGCKLIITIPIQE
jgi:PAS domain S-box-containing protein